MDAWFIVPSDKEKGFSAVYKRVREIQKGIKDALTQPNEEVRK